MEMWPEVRNSNDHKQKKKFCSCTIADYREPEEAEMTDREHIMKLYEMLADQQKQIDMRREMIGKQDQDNK